MDTILLEKAYKALGDSGYSLEELIKAFIAQIAEGKLPEGLPEKHSEPHFEDSYAYHVAASALADDFYRIYYVDLDEGRYTRFSRIKGKRPKLEEGKDFFADMKGRLSQYVHPHELPALLHIVERKTLPRTLAQSHKVRFVHRSNEFGRFRYHCLSAARLDKGPRVRRFVVAISDAEGEVLRERQLLEKARLANEDSLTGQGNRAAFTAAIKRLQKRIHQGKEVRCALLLGDMNGLKEVNDTQGHLAGDRLIKSVADHLQQAVYPSKVYRIGGDEFAVILSGKHFDSRQYILNGLIEASRQDIASGGSGVAFGLAEFDPSSDTDLMTVFSRADRAMYRNKAELKKAE